MLRAYRIGQARNPNLDGAGKMFRRRDEQYNQLESTAFSPGWRRCTIAIISSAVCLLMLYPPVASACPYTIRDVGFVDL
ncbi:hypothetical protein HQ563_09385, partial [bacterium]|nr:hypothetical protein [bacterium]